MFFSLYLSPTFFRKNGVYHKKKKQENVSQVLCVTDKDILILIPTFCQVFSLLSSGVAPAAKVAEKLGEDL